MPRVLFFVVLLVASAMAQQWDMSAVGGYAFAREQTVTSPRGTAKTGFQHGFAVGVVGTHHPHRYLSGEFRYLYRDSDLKLTGSGGSANFTGDTHAVHYDLLYHTKPKGTAVRPYVAAGGGLKVYRGTGQESSLQALSNFALLTKTKEVLPLLTVGAGVRVTLRHSMVLRAEFRDYITPFPTQVIAPAPGATLRGWLHDFMPTVGFGLTF